MFVSMKDQIFGPIFSGVRGHDVLPLAIVEL
jgi:hypothetical protein